MNPITLCDADHHSQTVSLSSIEDAAVAHCPPCLVSQTKGCATTPSALLSMSAAGHWHSVGCLDRQQSVAHVLMSTALQPFSNGSVMRACNVVRLVRRSRQTHGTPLFPACTSVVHVQTQIPATLCGLEGCSHVCLCPSPTGVHNPPVHLIPQNLVSAVLNKGKIQMRIKKSIAPGEAQQNEQAQHK